MEQKDHFNKIFWFCVSCTAVGLLYVFLITFIPIPKENVRFADTALGFFLGVLIAACVNYLTGGNPVQQKKPEGLPGTTEIELKATQTTAEPGKADEIVSN